MVYGVLRSVRRNEDFRALFAYGLRLVSVRPVISADCLRVSIFCSRASCEYRASQIFTGYDLRGLGRLLFRDVFLLSINPNAQV